jgi:hypothetical protein
MGQSAYLHLVSFIDKAVTFNLPKDLQAAAPVTEESAEPSYVCM